MDIQPLGIDMNYDDFILIVLVVYNIVILVMIVIMQLSQCQSQLLMIKLFGNNT